MKMNHILVIAAIAIPLVSCSFYGRSPSTSSPSSSMFNLVSSSNTSNPSLLEEGPTPTMVPRVGAGSPASGYCEKSGGRLEIKEASGGGKYGMCFFDDGSACEEWALFRKECKKGES